MKNYTQNTKNPISRFIIPFVVTALFVGMTLFTVPHDIVRMSVHAGLAGVCVYLYLCFFPMRKRFAIVGGIATIVFLVMNYIAGFALINMGLMLCGIIGAIVVLQ